MPYWQLRVHHLGSDGEAQSLYPLVLFPPSLSFFLVAPTFFSLFPSASSSCLPGGASSGIIHVCFYAFIDIILSRLFGKRRAWICKENKLPLRQTNGSKQEHNNTLNISKLILQTKLVAIFISLTKRRCVFFILYSKRSLGFLLWTPGIEKGIYSIKSFNQKKNGYKKGM